MIIIIIIFPLTSLLQQLPIQHSRCYGNNSTGCTKSALAIEDLPSFQHISISNKAVLGWDVQNYSSAQEGA